MSFPITITDPEKLSDFLSRFAQGSWHLMTLISRPGMGKSELIRETLVDKGLCPPPWEGHASPIDFYLDSFKYCAENESLMAAKREIREYNWEQDDKAPSRQLPRISEDFSDYRLSDGSPYPTMVLDDCRELYRKANDLIKVLGDSRPIRRPAWKTSGSRLREVGWQKSFDTKARMIICSNHEIDIKNHFGAMIDRGPLLLIRYSPIVLHEHAKEWFLDKNHSDLSERQQVLMAQKMGRVWVSWQIG